MTEKIFTNCFLVKTESNGTPEQVCLAMKKRGFGQGMWNGSGGKIERNETIEAAARREVQEELKVIIRELDKRGEINFILKQEGENVMMHAFWVLDWDNEPTETEEMRPRWFPTNQVPYAEMWASDKEWLPIILAGKKIKAKYVYSREGGGVEMSEMVEVKEFV